jgi:hypothetical protein
MMPDPFAVRMTVRVYDLDPQRHLNGPICSTPTTPASLAYELPVSRSTSSSPTALGRSTSKPRSSISTSFALRTWSASHVLGGGEAARLIASTTSCGGAMARSPPR